MSLLAVENSQSVLRHRPFVLFWFSRVLSTLAFQIQAVAVGWQMYALTGSTFKLGLVGLVAFLPMVFFSLVAGHVADRYDRRRIASTCQISEGLAVATLALSSLGGWVSPGIIFGCVAVIGAARAFDSPAMQALLPGLIPELLLPRAIAWAASATQTASIVGPALGGLLYALGPVVPYSAAATCFVIAGALSALIQVERTPPPPEPVSLRSVFSGVAFIRSRPAILGSISLDMFAVLLGGATALLPVYARDILHTGPWGLGLLRSAPAAGALTTSVFLAHHPPRRRVGRVMFGAVVVFGLATITFGLSRSLLLSLGALFVLGAADVVSVVIRLSLVQINTPDAMRGRVSAVNSLFIGTSNQLGEFESGVTASWFGTVPAVILGGIGTIVVATLWMLLFPDLRELDTLGNSNHSR
jgi:MFS family permease